MSILGCSLKVTHISEFDCLFVSSSSNTGAGNDVDYFMSLVGSYQLYKWDSFRHACAEIVGRTLMIFEKIGRRSSVNANLADLGVGIFDLAVA